MVEPILAAFEALCRTLSPASPRLPFVSNVTGALVPTSRRAIPRWVAPPETKRVRFADGLATLLGEPRILIEVGPGRTLSSLARLIRPPRGVP